MEVVGTAFVRIQAITTGLNKEIKDGIDRGLKDASSDVDGGNLGKKLGDEIGSEVRERVSKGIGDGVESSSKDNNTFKRFAQKIGDALYTGIYGELDKKGKRKGGLLASIKSGLGDLSKAFTPIARIFTGVIALTPAISGAVSAAIQYVTALIGYVGALSQAALGAGLALGGIGGAILLGLGPLVAAFLVQTDELEAFKEIAGEIAEEWKVVAEATQKELLPSLLDAFDLMGALIPLAEEFGSEVGAIAGDFALLAAETLTAETSQLRWRTILAGSTPILATLGRIALNFGDILSRLFEASLPLARDFAEVIEAASARWAALVNLAGLPGGGLDETMRRWYDMALLLGGALGDLTAALWDILDIGGTQSIPFIENFRTWAAEFRAFTSSETGQNKLRQIFDDAYEVASAFNGLLVTIGETIGGNVFEEGGNEGILEFIRVLEEDVVPALDTFITGVNDRLGPAMSNFATSFGEFFTALSGSGSLEITLTLLTGLVEAMTALMLVPGMQEFLGVLLGIAGAFAILKATGIVSIITTIAGAIGTLAAAMTAGGTATGIFGGAGVTLAAGLGAVAAAAAIVVGVIVAVVAAIALVIIHWDTLVEAFHAVGRFFQDPMERLEAFGETLSNLGGIIVDFINSGLEKIGEFFLNLPSLIGDAAGAMGEGLSAAFGIALEAVKAFPGLALDALASFGSTVLDAIVSGLAALPGLLRTVFVTAMQVAINALFLALFGLPLLVFRALQNFGPPVGRFLVQAFSAAFNFLAERLPQLWGAITEWFQGIPDKLADNLTALGSALAGVFSAAWEAVWNYLSESALPSLLLFFESIPDLIYSALSSLAGVVSGLFSLALDGAKAIVSVSFSDILKFFLDLPGNILGIVQSVVDAAKAVGSAIINGIRDGLSGAASLAGDIASSVRDALVTQINNLIDLLNDGIPNSLGWGPARIDIPDNPIPRIPLAMGGIFSSPTPAVVGEAGREVVIPLTRPQRAFDLATASGLFDVLARARGNNDMQAIPGGAGTGGGIMVNVQAMGASAAEVGSEVAYKLTWAMTTRRDR